MDPAELEVDEEEEVRAASRRTTTAPVPVAASYSPTPAFRDPFAFLAPLVVLTALFPGCAGRGKGAGMEKATGTTVAITGVGGVCFFVNFDLFLLAHSWIDRACCATVVARSLRL